MLKAIGWIIKMALFSTAILLAGEWISWDGRSLSHHLLRQVGSISDTIGDTGAADSLRGIGKKITRATDDAREGIAKTAIGLGHKLSVADSVTDRTEMQSAAPIREKLPSSERQKLKALIRELNGSGE